MLRILMVLAILLLPGGIVVASVALLAARALKRKREHREAR